MLALLLLLCAPLRAELLDPALVEQGLPLLARHDIRGLGAEAAALAEWARGKESVPLEEAASGLGLSPRFVEALRNLNSYHASFAAAQAAPVTRAELERWALSPGGVAAIRGLFEETIAQLVVYNGRPMIPEIHGQAELAEGALVLNRTPNPVLPVLAGLKAARSDADALRALVSRHPETVAALDPRGNFRKYLDETLPAWQARGHPSAEKLRDLLHLHVDAMLELADGTSAGTVEANLSAAVERRWGGRLAGIWHTHPPYLGAKGWDDVPEEMLGPSSDDLETAVRFGQNITIAFLPGGFNLYDLSGLDSPAAYVESARVIRYRDAGWREHFLTIHRRVAPR